MLQATRAKLNQHDEKPSCLLCPTETEYMYTEHFLLRCESLTGTRQPFLDKIGKTLWKYIREKQFERDEQLYAIFEYYNI